jgi:hypothetical protein
MAVFRVIQVPEGEKINFNVLPNNKSYAGKDRAWSASYVGSR